MMQRSTRSTNSQSSAVSQHEVPVLTSNVSVSSTTVSPSTAIASPQLLASAIVANSSNITPNVVPSTRVSTPIFPSRLPHPALVPSTPPVSFPFQGQQVLIPSVSIAQAPAQSLIVTSQNNVGSYVPPTFLASGQPPSMQPNFSWPAVQMHGFISHATSSVELQTGMPPSLFSGQNSIPGTGAVNPGVTFPVNVISHNGSSPVSPNVFSPFVVGPGIPPVSPKLVASILSGDLLN